MIDILIAGLGNPGEKYAGTRHNIGWMVSNAINIERKIKWKILNDILLYSEFKIFNKNILNIMPLTYMNNSGKAVKLMMDKYKVAVENILVITDEYNFPVGKIHLKKGGSSGGHNGVASVIEEIDSSDFMRLRCGIGNDFPQGMMMEYVLGYFPSNEQDNVLKMIDKSIDAIEHIARAGFARAMSDINSERLWKE
jgi:PTH1 family peptidyl-tRNA hydrolase